MSEASLRAILNQIYRNTHSIIGDPLIDVILFGSYARGDYDEGSDIDIALIVDMDREDLKQFDNDINNMSSEILLENSVLVSVISIPAKEFEYWKKDLPFYRNVDTEGVRLKA